MTPRVEKRLLQAIVTLACLVPLSSGAAGVIYGPRWLHGVTDVSADLDSHFRYMSGIFLGVGICFAACIPHIERKGAYFRRLGFLVVMGGAARLFSLLSVGAPGLGHRFGLAMELIVVPLLMLWQWRVEKLYRAAPPSR